MMSESYKSPQSPFRSGVPGSIKQATFSIFLRVFDTFECLVNHK